MIDGNYAVYLTDRHIRSDQQNCGFAFGIPCVPNSTYRQACIEISESGRTATGTIKLQNRRNGNWETKQSGVTLRLRSGSGTHSVNEGGTWVTVWHGPRESGWNGGCQAGTGGEGEPECNSSTPTNWGSRNRQFNQHGWKGHLNSGNQLRVAVDNHVLKMTGEGRVTTDHGRICP
ncbi:MAG: hypothetical protein OXC63_15710 [Aestuariivita sp.]|nr:hypothetical protein [Aestuariivita sp.]MCY4346044.1 hypothetical protein [Aestuariivita sp.]